MARKKRRKAKPRTIASTRISDDELIARLQDKGISAALDRSISEAEFETIVERLMTQLPSRENPHFYCRKCGEYHLKSHPHHVR